MSLTRFNSAFVIALITSSVFFASPLLTYADTKSDLETKISATNSAIENLEKEIQGYQKQIDELSSQADSLSATVKSLDLTQKKLAADIQLTQGKIEAKNWEIQSLGTQIGQKQETIEDDSRIIRQSLVLINQAPNSSVAGIILSQNSLSKSLDQLDNLSTLQGNLVHKIGELRQVKQNLESNKAASEKAKSELLALTNQLQNQRKVVVATQNEKNDLLKDTKLSQSSYKLALSQKKALKESFEKEVLQYESQIKRIVDLSKIHTGKGVLSWPLDDVSITQYFGNTPFATANPQIYNGAGHTGIDLKASIGTVVRAALTGTVIATGNTDIVRTCYSYGKWVMIKHPNGLSTLYAHLSLPTVAAGQAVQTGDIIGYSGNTGYSTGPHLHFGVYATEGVDITSFKNSKNCPNVVIPFASLNAYLNPLSFL